MNMGYTIKDTLYTDKVQIIVYSREEDAQSLKSKMTDITSGTAELSESESFYLSEKDGQIIHLDSISLINKFIEGGSHNEK